MTHTQRGALKESDLLISRAYVGGEWIDGSKAPIAVEDPFTLNEFGEVPNLGEAEAQRAIDAADAALPACARKTAEER